MKTILITEALTNALGNPHFSSDKVFEALKGAEQNGSINALLNILPELEKFAKENYGTMPKLKQFQN